MKKNNGAFYHALASNIKYILDAVVEDQRNFKVVIKSFAKQENIDIESKDEIGFMDARDVFMIYFELIYFKNNYLIYIQ